MVSQTSQAILASMFKAFEGLTSAWQRQLGIHGLMLPSGIDQLILDGDQIFANNDSSLTGMNSQSREKRRVLIQFGKDCPGAMPLTWIAEFARCDFKSLKQFFSIYVMSPEAWHEAEKKWYEGLKIQPPGMRLEFEEFCLAKLAMKIEKRSAAEIRMLYLHEVDESLLARQLEIQFDLTLPLEPTARPGGNRMPRILRRGIELYGSKFGRYFMAHDEAVFFGIGESTLRLTYKNAAIAEADLAKHADTAAKARNPKRTLSLPGCTMPIGDLVYLQLLVKHWKWTVSKVVADSGMAHTAATLRRHLSITLPLDAASGATVEADQRKIPWQVLELLNAVISAWSHKLSSRDIEEFLSVSKSTIYHAAKELGKKLQPMAAVNRPDRTAEMLCCPGSRFDLIDLLFMYIFGRTHGKDAGWRLLNKTGIFGKLTYSEFQFAFSGILPFEWLDNQSEPRKWMNKRQLDVMYGLVRRHKGRIRQFEIAKVMRLSQPRVMRIRVQSGTTSKSWRKAAAKWKELLAA